MTKEIYLPDVVGGGYGEFFRDKKRYRVLMGGKGSKKSATTAINFIYRLMKYPGSNLLVVRAVMDTHRASTFAQLKWAQERLGVSHLWKNTVSPMEMIYLPTGQKILFRGFDDVMKLASTTVPIGSLCWVWIEEAYEIGSEVDFDTLDLSVPRGAVAPPLFKQTTLTFNPWNESHWLKSRFFDRVDENVSTYRTTYLCNEFLDAADIAVFERMKRENPRRYAVAGLGQWGVTEGLVYDRWRVEPFDIGRLGITVGEDGRDIDESWRLLHIRGLDFGYTNDPTAFICAAVDKEAKRCWIYSEFSEKMLTNPDIAERISRMGCAKDRIRADAAEPKSIEELKRCGILRVTPAEKGRDSVRAGINLIREYDIVVHPSCIAAINELGAYRWKTGRDGKPINEPCDCENHLMDALRYAFDDVKHFRPVSPEERRERMRRSRTSVSADDMKGGWS